MTSLRSRYGDWALVTGASSGIGRQFAQTLAAAGMHLVLVARRLELLHQLQQQLAGKYAVQVVCLQIDLARDGQLQPLLEACKIETSAWWSAMPAPAFRDRSVHAICRPRKT